MRSRPQSGPEAAKGRPRSTEMARQSCQPWLTSPVLACLLVQNLPRDVFDMIVNRSVSKSPVDQPKLLNLAPRFSASSSCASQALVALSSRWLRSRSLLGSLSISSSCILISASSKAYSTKVASSLCGASGGLASSSSRASSQTRFSICCCLTVICIGRPFHVYVGYQQPAGAVFGHSRSEKDLHSGLRAARSRRAAGHSRSFAQRPLMKTDPPAVRRFWFDRLWSEIVPRESLLLAGKKKFKPLQVCRLRLEGRRVARIDCNKCVCTRKLKIRQVFGVSIHRTDATDPLSRLRC